MFNLLSPLFVQLVVLCVATVAFAVTPGQTDNFQDGTTMNWEVGVGPNGAMPPFPPANADGGPNGAGDLFLQLTSTGGDGAGGRMVVINGSQWTGDYIGGGVTGIQLDVNNMGGVPMESAATIRAFLSPRASHGRFHLIDSRSRLLPAAAGKTFSSPSALPI